jgi:hypothetical protein
MRTTIRSVVAVVALGVTITVADPALADTTTFKDPPGDAPARYDLTRITIENTTDAVTVHQRVRDLRGDRTQIFGVSVSTHTNSYLVQTVRRKNGVVTNRFLSGDGSKCAIRSRWRPARDTIRMRIPRDCLVGAGAVRLSAFIGAGDGTFGDPWDFTKRVRVGQD